MNRQTVETQAFAIFRASITESGGVAAFLLRLAPCRLTADVIKRDLNLLGIDVIEQM